MSSGKLSCSILSLSISSVPPPSFASPPTHTISSPQSFFFVRIVATLDSSALLAAQRHSFILEVVIETFLAAGGFLVVRSRGSSRATACCSCVREREPQNPFYDCSETSSLHVICSPATCSSSFSVVQTLHARTRKEEEGFVVRHRRASDRAPVAIIVRAGYDRPQIRPEESLNVNPPAGQLIPKDEKKCHRVCRHSRHGGRKGLARERGPRRSRSRVLPGMQRDAGVLEADSLHMLSFQDPCRDFVVLIVVTIDTVACSFVIVFNTSHPFQ